MTNNSLILNKIQALGKKIIPDDGHLFLYGSQARGDYNEQSDWDLLILLNKDKTEFIDFDIYSYPFIELGCDFEIAISAHIYTIKEWESMSFSLFYKNVEKDKKELI